MSSRTSWRGKRVRRTLIWAVALFLLAQIGASVLIDYRFPLAGFPSAATVVGRMASRPSGPEVLCLGSSRFQGAFREAELSDLMERECRLSHRLNFLNAAVQAADHTAHERIFGYLLEAGARPRLVVIEVSPDFLNWYNFCAGSNALRMVRWNDLSRHLGQVVLSLQIHRLLTAELLPLYQHREQILALLTGHADGPATVPRRDFAPPEAIDRASSVDWNAALAMPPSPLSEQAVKASHDLARRSRTSWLRGYQIASVQADGLRRLIARCREIGAEVWLVTPPSTALNRESFTPAIEGPYLGFINGLGCRHIDCRDWMADEWFCDSHHLTEDGAKLFTRRFVRRVLAPGWQPGGVVSR